MNAGTAWAVLVSNTNSVSTTYSHAGLSASTTRHYRVSAINAEGTGRVSKCRQYEDGCGAFPVRRAGWWLPGRDNHRSTLSGLRRPMTEAPR